MNGKSESSQPYVSGHSDEEMWRLQKQAELWHPATRRFLEEVEIKARMKVLDVARRRAEAAAYTNVSFVQGEVEPH